MIGFCTDSNAQLPPDLAARYGVEVVPLTVTVDGQPFAEGVDLDADGFYARFADGAAPEVSTAAPAPGAFLEAWQRLAERGCDEIVSVHIGSAVSGTLNAARLATSSAPVPVHLVDTGTASFAIACCLWEAAEAVAAGGTAADAVAVAEQVGATCGNVFVVQALDLPRSGGRLADGAEGSVGAGAIPVLSLVDGRFQPVTQVRSVDEAAGAMADVVCAGGDRLRVGIGVADAAAAPFWQALEERLAAAPEVVDLVRYRIGPSVGAHTGPGTAGAVFYPTAL